MFLVLFHGLLEKNESELLLHGDTAKLFSLLLSERKLVRQHDVIDWRVLSCVSVLVRVREDGLLPLLGLFAKSVLAVLAFGSFLVSLLLGIKELIFCGSV